MNSKYSNQDLINATLEIYNEFEPSQTKNITKSTQKKISKKVKPLILSKEIKKEKKTTTKRLSKYKLPKGKKISNNQRLIAYKKKRNTYNSKLTLRLNKIIKFENKDYLLLDKIINRDLKIVKMKRPST